MSTQTSKIVYDLSQLIIQGALGPGETVTEEHVAERFAVSRTPVRQALIILLQVGLLQRSAGRSFTVRRFAHQEILNAIEVRAVLEGLAIRSVAEHKNSGRVLRELDACLAHEVSLIERMEHAGLTTELIAQYYNSNTRFHGIILQGAVNETLINALEAVSRIPFVSVGSLARFKDVTDEHSLRMELRYFIYSHLQHNEMVMAIREGQGARAEAVMRSHALLSTRNLNIELPEPFKRLIEL
jgi:GntR family transcriptional regulator of vanillate catabolism